MSFNLVPPEEPVANIVYRKKVRQWALKSQRNRDLLLAKCKEDFFFWLKTFVFIMEPRPESAKHPVIPMIPWSHQYPFFEKLLEHRGKHDIGCEKSRGEGASWSVVLVFLWRWIFYPLESYAIVSRNMETADTYGNPSSLGGKLDFALQRLPQWMVGVKGTDYLRNITKHTWVNVRNESSIVATSTTGDLAAGMRYTAMLLDELGRFPRGDDEDAMSATEPVTDCRILVSTYDGADGAFYRAMSEDSSMVKTSLLWYQNPTRNQNLFRIDTKRMRLLKPEEDEPFDAGGYDVEFFGSHFRDLRNRGYDVDDKTALWSPWLVGRALRPRMSPKSLAQEYRADPVGSSSSFFPPSLVGPLIRRARPPVISGDVLYSQERLVVIGFTKNVHGRLSLWRAFNPTTRRPVMARYIIGADIANGTGGAFGSNSTLCILDRDTGEKVGEYANPSIKPEAFAELTISICKWFEDDSGSPAFLIFESNGTGQSFRARLLDSGFTNYFFRMQQDSVSRKRTKRPGWHSSRDTKRELLSRYRYALSEGFFFNPSEFALKEALHYVDQPGGSVEYKGGATEKDDPSNAGVLHGDRVIADALANFAMENFGAGSVQAISVNPQTKLVGRPPRGSFAERALERREMDARKRSLW